MDAPLVGGLGGTYAGSPVGCEAALAVIDVIVEENLLAAANRIGVRMGEKLREMQSLHPEIIGEVRSERGAMVAVELVQNGNPEQPDPGLAKGLVAEAAKRGLLILSCGIRGNVIRFLPALTIPDSHLEEGLTIFEDAFEHLVGK
jgi:4-aminobutyrate aminotransferase/(S)-3-amino-2-methylpropionate transaminase